MNASPESDRRFATTLARGLAVLRAFRPSDDGLGNADLAQRTGLPKSTVSRLTYTLQSLGYLNHAHRRDRYRPGPALLALGNIAALSMSFVELAGGPMQRLADETGTLSLMLVRDGEKLLIVKTWRPRDVSSLWLEVGHRLPVAGTSSGHALLAALPEDSLSAAIEEAGIAPDRAEEIRRKAYAQLVGQGFVVTSPEEYYTPNIAAASKPFHTHDLSEPVIFSCGAMPKDLSQDRIRAEVGPKLAAAVQDLERVLGQGSAIARRG